MATKDGSIKDADLVVRNGNKRLVIGKLREGARGPAVTLPSWIPKTDGPVSAVPITPEANKPTN